MTTTSPTMTAAPAPPINEVCDSCEKSLIRCEVCGRYTDDKTSCTCPIPEWHRVETEWVETLRQTHESPAEYAMVCPRCGGEVGEDWND